MSEKIWRVIRDTSRTLQHGFTYQAHPPSAAAGLAVQRYLEKHHLIHRCRQAGERLSSKLETLCDHSHVGDVRGKGLLQVVEFVEDSAGRRPFAGGLRISKRIFANLRSRGVLVYPGSGTADGGSGDHILVAPPFIIEDAEIDWLARQIGEAVTEVCDGAATGAHSG